MPTYGTDAQIHSPNSCDIIKQSYLFKLIIETCRIQSQNTSGSVQRYTEYGYAYKCTTVIDEIQSRPDGGVNCWGCEVGVCGMMRPMPVRETECIVGRQWSATGPESVCRNPQSPWPLPSLQHLYERYAPCRQLC